MGLRGISTWNWSSDVAFVEWTAARWADVGQRCLVDLVDLFGARRLAVGLGAVVLARLAGGLLGLAGGLALGEGPCLTFAGAQGCVELTAEPLALGLQVVDPSLKGLAVSTPDQFHAGIIRSSGTRSCADHGRQGTLRLELRARIKYGRKKLHSPQCLQAGYCSQESIEQ
jgi:hypothetical protein